MGTTNQLLAEWRIRWKSCMSRSYLDEDAVVKYFCKVPDFTYQTGYYNQVMRNVRFTCVWCLLLFWNVLNSNPESDAMVDFCMGNKVFHWHCKALKNWRKFSAIIWRYPPPKKHFGLHLYAQIDKGPELPDWTFLLQHANSSIRKLLSCKTLPP